MIQSLKYFTKPENRAESYIPGILAEIQSNQSFSPLLILKILTKNKNIKFELVKKFFVLNKSIINRWQN